MSVKTPSKTKALARPLAVLALLSLVVTGVWLSLVHVILPAPAPKEVTPVKLSEHALTQHLMFVVVDGLRYDVATDPELMPHFSSAMKEEASAEIWAGRVSMTSSAVMSFGTGQRGRFEQIVRNINPDPPPFNSWLLNARRQGLRVEAAGDPAWGEMFGAGIDEHRDDPKGVAIDVDFNSHTFRDVRALLAHRPNVLIAHFVTPDHQGHAYGILSQRYRKHIHEYDGLLHTLLSEVGPEWTVVVTSDHGAVDSGTHGSDTPLQRKTPAYAFGPGIKKGARPDVPLPQVDMAPTLAVLIGAAAPAHGQGIVISEWLDVPQVEAAAISCRNAEGVLAFGKAAVRDVEDARAALSPCHQDGAPAARIAASRKAVRIVDAAVTDATGITSPKAWLTAAITVLLLTLMALIALGRRILPWLPGAYGVLALSTAAVYQVERLPGGLPDVARAVCFVIGLLPALAFLLSPARFARWVNEHPRLAPLWIVGLLVSTYTPNTQPLTWVVLGLGVLVFTLSGWVHEGAPPIIRQRPRVSWMRFTVALVVFVLLYRVGTKTGGIVPSWYGQNAVLMQVGAVASVSLWSIGRLFRSGAQREHWPVVAVGLPLIVAALFLRPYMTPWLGRASVVGFAALAAYTFHRRAYGLGLHLGLVSYAFVSRIWEVPAVVALVYLAEAAGTALARHREGDPEDPPLASTLVLVAFSFSILNLLRIGMQGNLDFGAMDFGAGGFGDPHVPAWVVGFALVHKYVAPALLLLVALLAPLPRAVADRVLTGLTVAFIGRGAALTLMLFVCGASFWTGLRVLGDWPFAMLGVAVAASAWLLSRYSSASRSSSS